MSIRHLVDHFARRPDDEVPVWGLDELLRYGAADDEGVLDGVRPVFRPTLASGKTVRATENHPFLTVSGWTPLGNLRTGERVAVPRHACPRLRSTSGFSRTARFAPGARIMSSKTGERPGRGVEAMGCRIGSDVYPMAERDSAA